MHNIWKDPILLFSPFRAGVKNVLSKTNGCTFSINCPTERLQQMFIRPAGGGGLSQHPAMYLMYFYTYTE